MAKKPNKGNKTMTNENQTSQEQATDDLQQSGPVLDQGELGNETPQDSQESQAPKVTNVGTEDNSTSNQEKVTSPDPVVTKTTEETKTSPEASSALNDLVEKVSADKAAADIISGFVNYAEEMKPGRQMSNEAGARHQVSLYRNIQFMVNTGCEDFNNLFATVLKFVDENSKAAFSARYAFRFTDQMVLNKNDIQGFIRFMNLLTTAAAVKGRNEAIRQIDFNRTLEYGFTDEGKQRILHFFGK
jgi:hypothetical protein